MKILVSACLLGRNCKYSGGNNLSGAVTEFVKDKDVIEVCPEVLAGLGIPRMPMEIVDGSLINRNGENVDGAVRSAVEKIIKQIADEEIDCAILKSRSPTCGVHEIYDGTFSGKRIPGAGVLAQALLEAGYKVMDDEDIALTL